MEQADKYFLIEFCRGGGVGKINVKPKGYIQSIIVMLQSGSAFQDPSQRLYQKLKWTLHMIWLHWGFNLFNNVVGKNTFCLVKTWPHSLTGLEHISISSTDGVILKLWA